jgi:type III secretion system (T3SS) SseB-like protein
VYILNQKGDELKIQNNVLQQGTQLHIQSFERDGRTWLPIFSSLERLEHYIRNDSNYLQLHAKDFFEITRGAHVILNPGSPYGKEFLPEEIEQLLDGSIFKPLQTYTTPKDTQVLIGQPAVYPNELVRVLSAYFEKNPHVHKAYLVQYFNQEADEKPHLLIGIEGKGDWQQVVGDAGMIASEVIGTGEVIDFMRLDQSGLSKSIIRQTKPFYQRSLLGKLFG